jgi:hypothetical protein
LPVVGSEQEGRSQEIALATAAQHIDTIPFFFDQALYASDLTGYTFDSSNDLFTDMILDTIYIYPV